MTRLGYQIPNFTYPGVAPGAIFENVVAQAKAAEAAASDGCCSVEAALTTVASTLLNHDQFVTKR